LWSFSLIGSISVMEGNKINENFSESTTVVHYSDKLSPTPGPLPFCPNSIPGICSQYACSECFDTTIVDCAECSIVAIAFIFCYFVVIGLAILLANVLTICVGVKHHKEGKANKMDYCRSSLAGADLMTGKNNYCHIL